LSTTHPLLPYTSLFRSSILDDDVLARIGLLELHPAATIEQLRAIFVARYFVTPLLEGTFGELHDVALVNEGHGASIIVHRILKRSEEHKYEIQSRESLE